ncbi:MULTISPECIES: serine/threonine-protein kinase [Actinoalloteichus]|uniref:non-specific serine/threonine protein kinase n=1 Tax=Actinoalloteichus fjordicus TaxID=1612552 RepID=A0AAC9LAN7_9PSEU|nr:MULTISPECIES: serine/threonine-protein kinase [Actinoalloteichus]APU14112.1 serine/threonine protein kinase [Actinoalloteichus fjordicus]APU20060.1 serine/threonine protein kinase [Actinoalloteichus sp. GBA129-24]
MAGETGGPSERRLLAGRYRIDGLLGRGGMSEVFHGYDERLDRQVAIKVLRPSSAGSVPAAPDSPAAVEILDALERDRRRFLREIRTTAQLEHPGTPAVYDTGIETMADGSSQLWLVMQLLRGSTLEAVLDHTDYASSSPDVAWSAAIGAQIAAVLADVHRVDVVHRDIKPANVMLVDGGLVKVLDFGIAILRGAGALPRLTQVDKTVGTPVYMSPEQYRGRIVTSASDIYSLGCLLCELLTGDVPFHETVGSSLRDQHLSSAPPSVRARRAALSGEVDELVKSMLAKEPSARPSATEVYAALVPLISDARSTPVDGHRDPTDPFRRPLLAAPRPRSSGGDRGSFTDAEFDRLNANVQVLLDDDRPSQAVRLIEDAIERAGDDRALSLLLRELHGAALFNAGEYTRAARVLEVVVDDYLEFRQADDARALNAAYQAGHAYAEIGKPDKALPQLRFYVQNAVNSDDSDESARIFESRFVIAQMLAVAGYVDEALTELDGIRPMLIDAFGSDSAQVRNLARQRQRLGLPEAEPDGRLPLEK